MIDKVKIHTIQNNIAVQRGTTQQFKISNVTVFGRINLQRFLEKAVFRY